MLRLAIRHEQRLLHASLTAGLVTAGSEEENDLCLPFPGVSRRHFSIERSEGGVLLTDLGSKNGLVVRGERRECVLLRPGEFVQVGRARIELEEVDTADGELALSLPAARPEPQPRAGHETSSVPLASESSAAAGVVRIIRRIERAGMDPSTSAGRERLAESRLALGAKSLFVARVEEGALVCAAGELPGQDLLAELAAALGSAAEVPEECLRRSDGTWIVARRLASLAAREVLAAHLLGLAVRPHAWQLDFLDYLAAKLDRTLSPTRRRGGSTGAGDCELELPEDFVAGESAAIQGLLAHLRATVRSQLDVVLLGETGTGKELFARTVHASGPNASGPFVPINCAAIPADLLEAELFGVEARVATGVDPRPGLFLKAEKGSLFLDEIGDMPEALQAKLLRALQEREILPVGSRRAQKIQVRVISASNKNLPRLVQQGKFRSDLFYRLRGLQFHLPPLRERREDIPHLLLAFAQRAASGYGKHVAGVSRKALGLLMAHDWPGNVRELKSEVERAVLLCPDGDALASEHFGPVRWALENKETAELAGGGHLDAVVGPEGAVRPEQGSARGVEPWAIGATGIVRSSHCLQDQLDALERRLITEALTAAQGNKTAAARGLGVTRNGLAIKMKRLGIPG